MCQTASKNMENITNNGKKKAEKVGICYILLILHL